MTATGDRFGNVSAAVLTGGASSRMGSDKAQLAIGGVANATRLATLCASLFEEVLLVGGAPPADAPGRRVLDLDGPASGLRGAVGALEAARAERVLLVATDLPLLTPEFLLGLVAWPEADAVVPRPGGRAQPLCALYRREPALAAARPLLEAERLKLQLWLDALDTAYIEDHDLQRIDPTGTALTNVNRPEDAARAEALLRGHRPRRER